ncbi:hypothetical protein R1sor_023304 [Riccia sorocarpa]|uniref:Uncharacterized protein n=1 Tax=Riccia sorocarpa TaxID=122646 RepID=A0ABD3GN24_9MARC
MLTVSCILIEMAVARKIICVVGWININTPEWLDQSPRTKDAYNQPEAETGNDRRTCCDQPHDPIGPTTVADDIPAADERTPPQNWTISTPSSGFFLIEREELPDAGEEDIDLLLRSGYAIGAGPKHYRKFEGKVYAWPDYIDLV